MRVHLILSIALASFSVLMAQDALAQAYPTRPIKWIIPASAGSPIDAIARKVVDVASANLGQPIVIENKPGATGSIAAAEVARATPDGYTFLLTVPDAIVSAIATVPALSYDPTRDLMPIMKVSSGPAVIIANPRVPGKDLKEFEQIAKTKVQPYSYASFGKGTFSHQIFATFAKRANVALLNATYSGSPSATQDVIAGHVDMTITAPGFAASLISEGKVKALAVMAQNRSPRLPDVPTMRELGYDDFVLANEIWIGLFAPMHTSAEAIDRMRGSVLKALADPSVVEVIKSSDQSPVGNTQKEFESEIANELSIIPSLIRALD